MRKSQPLISVVMPVHNSESYVTYAVQSVLAQTYTNFELICVVNNSSDASESILLELAETDPRIVVIPNNLGEAGSGKARNQGMALSKGDYISFLDDDDFYEVDFLSRLYETLIEYDVDIAQSAIRYIFKSRARNQSYGSGLIQGEQVAVRVNMADGLTCLYPMVCGKLYKRALFDDIEMKNIRFEDIEFTPRILENASSAFILDEFLYNYNKRYSTVTNWDALTKDQIQEYLDAIYLSILPYYTDRSRAIRNKYHLDEPKTVYANINNLIRGLNQVILDKPAAFHAELATGYQNFLSRVEAHLTKDEWARFLTKLVEPSVMRRDFRLQRNVISRKALKFTAGIWHGFRSAFSQHRITKLIEPWLYLIDFLVPKNPNIWLFSSWAHYPPHTMDNPRSIFECVKDDPNIKKVVCVHGKFKDEVLIKEGQNVKFVRVISYMALYYMLRSGVFWTGNALSPKFGYRNMMKRAGRRKLVQLWHAITLKKIGLTLDHDLELYWHDDANQYALIESTSDLDRQTMIESFSPKRPEAVVVTGVPRHDLLLMPEQKLPADYRQSLEVLRERKGTKKLFLYAPTWRGKLDDKSELTIPQLKKLDALFLSHNTLFGQRMHLNNRKHTRRGFLSDNVFNLDEFPETTVLLREVDGLITDYSSIYFDLMQRDKPVILYQPDIESYGHSRGLVYDPEMSRPHDQTVDSFDKLYAMLETVLSEPDKFDKRYADVKARFMTYSDDKNALRVIKAMEKA